MRISTIKHDGKEMAAIITNEKILPLREINAAFGKSFSIDLFEIISSGQLDELNRWYNESGKGQVAALQEKYISRESVSIGPLFRYPRKIWGIGLNYVEHAADLSEKAPVTEPASFMKPDTAIIGPGEEIMIPVQSERTTAEAELGIIIGKKCRNIAEKDVSEVIAGYTTVLDMTAEDILQKNPRYLTRAKSFDTFLSFGPVLVTSDEVEDVRKLKVSTVLNGHVHRENFVSNMTFSPDFLISFHSKVMTLLPGDIILTGTPGAAVVKAGDFVECRIEGFEKLGNPVIDLKNKEL